MQCGKNQPKIHKHTQLPSNNAHKSTNRLWIWDVWTLGTILTWWLNTGGKTKNQDRPTVLLQLEVFLNLHTVQRYSSKMEPLDSAVSEWVEFCDRPKAHLAAQPTLSQHGWCIVNVYKICPCNQHNQLTSVLDLLHYEHRDRPSPRQQHEALVQWVSEMSWQ